MKMYVCLCVCAHARLCLCVRLYVRVSQAAANEVQALPDMPALCAPLRPPLPLDRELRGRAEPPLVRALPGRPTAGAAVGAAHGLVRAPRPHAALHNSAIVRK